MPHILTPRVTIYHERQGTGVPLLYISGTGGDLRVKPNIFDSPSADGLLAQHFDLLAYDQRGLGRTQRPPGPYTMRDYADDAAALLDAVGWDRCRVFGVSFGGMVAQEFAVRHPRRVERLALACTSAGGAGAQSYPLHGLHGLPTEDRARRMIALNDTRFADLERENPDRYARILQMTVDNMAAQSAFPDQAPGENNVTPDEGARLQLEARRHHDVYDRLPRLTMPVLVAAGRYDNIAPPANSEAITTQIPNATLEIFEGGHLFLIQDRTAFPHIAEFLLA
jgi:3-oxoadipate enol-lactonase